MNTNEAPVATLKNGISVCNFSSPHSFTFDDGTVLEACSPERCRNLSLLQEEVVYPNPIYPKLQDINLEFKMSDLVLDALEELKNFKGIVLVPFPVMEAIKENGMRNDSSDQIRDEIQYFPFRVCRVADRVNKTLFSNKFCV